MLTSSKRSYKLALRRHDDETLRALVDGNDPSEVEKNAELVVEAYHYFKELLNSPEADPHKVYRGIVRLNIVDVKLERHIDNPQLVFESLNSTGVDLSQSDLVRNYLLMGLSETEQTRLYNNYWSKLEMLFSEAGSTPDSFLRDYMVLKKEAKTQTRADSIYVEFKEFWRSSSDVKCIDTLLDDMVQFAHYYVSFLRPERIDSKQLATAMWQVHLGGSSTHALLIMRLYECYKKNTLSYDDFIRALNLIASYLVRRTVLGLQTRGYWSVFARIAHSIRAYTKIMSTVRRFER